MAQNDLKAIATIITELDDNRVSRLSYTSAAFDNDIINSVDSFDYNAEQNIPRNPDTNPKVLDKGMRAQSSSLSRDGMNHFIGRTSYNLNKFIQRFKAFLSVVMAAWAHNAYEYDPGAHYVFNDVCYRIENVRGVKTIVYYQRISQSPPYIQNVPPGTALHWAVMPTETNFAGVAAKTVVVEVAGHKPFIIPFADIGLRTGSNYIFYATAGIDYPYLRAINAIQITVTESGPKKIGTPGLKIGNFIIGEYMIPKVKNAVRVSVYHDTVPYTVPKTGSPFDGSTLKIASPGLVIGDFSIGEQTEDETFPVNLLCFELASSTEETS
jgi:hypothetical protein